MKILRIYIASIFISISCTFLILYTTVFSLGYSFLEYVHFIRGKIEIYSFLVGLLLAYYTLKKKGKNNEIFKRHTAKFR